MSCWEKENRAPQICLTVSGGGGQRRGGGPDIPAQESRHAEKGGVRGIGPLSGEETRV